MFAAIPFPCAQPRTTPERSGPAINKPTVSLFGQRSTGESTTAPDCSVPARDNTPLPLGDPVPTPRVDRQERPVETNNLSGRKMNLTVETLEKQSYLLSLQIWHYECQYGLPHSEFSKRFEFGGASPIPSSRGQDEEGHVDQGAEISPREGLSVVKSEPTSEAEIVVKKEEWMDDSDDTVEEGLWTEEQPLNQDKPTSERLFENNSTGKPSDAPAVHETSFGSLFGSSSSGINFGCIAQPSTNIFGGIVQTKSQLPTTSTNFKLPQVSATGKTSAPETDQLAHRQLELTVETMQKQSHLLSLQILQYEYRHQIPHSEFSRKIALQAAMRGGAQKEGGAAEVEPEPIDYTVSSGNL